MKKLITIMMVAFAAVAAKADLTLYWQVANYALFDGASYARLYGIDSNGSQTRLATAGLTSGVDSTTISSILNGVLAFSDYSSYIVELLDSNRTTTLAVSDTYTGSLASYIYNTGTDDQPPASPWQVSAFTIPEPTSALMLLVGLAGLALKRKNA